MNVAMKVARLKKQLSQEQLAKRVSVSRQTIILIEKDEFNPSIKLCIAIAKTLDQSLDDLFWHLGKEDDSHA